jgi:hypothetical protein
MKISTEIRKHTANASAEPLAGNLPDLRPTLPWSDPSPFRGKPTYYFGIMISRPAPTPMLYALRLLVASMLLIPVHGFAGDLVFHGGPERVHLLELFTSEGCSSCPPAEERLSAFQRDPGLWKRLVPVSFHVDYWDNLGWPDRYATSAYTDRQRSYARDWGSDSVYTPEFVLDGREFPIADIPVSSASGGDLTVELSSSRTLSVHYQSADPSPTTWQAHIATLGMALETDVRGGENHGRRLRQDFVALSLLTLALSPKTGSGTLTLGPPKDGERAMAVWITQGDHNTPVQATGGWTR